MLCGWFLNLGKVEISFQQVIHMKRSFLSLNKHPRGDSSLSKWAHQLRGKHPINGSLGTCESGQQSPNREEDSFCCFSRTSLRCSGSWAERTMGLRSSRYWPLGRHWFLLLWDQESRKPSCNINVDFCSAYNSANFVGYSVLLLASVVITCFLIER